VKLNNSLYSSRVFLPLYDVRDIQSSQKSARISKTILLAEDNEPLRQMLHTYLDVIGFDVLEASNGLEALKLFKERKSSIDLLFTDIEMPVMNGIELALEIHELDPGLKILLTSGNAERYQDASVVNPFHFLPKPYPLSDLDQKLTQLLKKSQVPRSKNTFLQN
jgi:CheY-like chemotaxis protein